MDLLFGTASVVKTATGMTAFDTFLYGSAITGLFGFLINIAGFMSIKVVSSLDAVAAMIV